MNQVEPTRIEYFCRVISILKYFNIMNFESEIEDYGLCHICMIDQTKSA